MTLIQFTPEVFCQPEGLMEVVLYSHLLSLGEGGINSKCMVQSGMSCKEEY